MCVQTAYSKPAGCCPAQALWLTSERQQAAASAEDPSDHVPLLVCLGLAFCMYSVSIVVSLSVPFTGAI